MKKLIYSEARALIELREGIGEDRLATLFGMRIEDLQERINTYLYHLYKTGFTAEELSVESGFSIKEIQKRLGFEADKRNEITKFNIEKSYYIKYIRGYEVDKISIFDVEDKIVEKALHDEAERRGVVLNNNRKFKCINDEEKNAEN